MPRRDLSTRDLGVVQFTIARLPLATQIHGHADLEGAGYVGLMRAAERFDPERGLRFCTFAVPFVRGEILEELRRWNGRAGTAKREAVRVDVAACYSVPAPAETEDDLLDRVDLASEIGEQLGVTEARAHQIGTRGLAKLRARLRLCGDSWINRPWR